MSRLPETASTSIALIGTSTACSLSCRAYAMTSAAKTVRPRLHHVSPTTLDTRIATSTPATTLPMRCQPERMLWYGVTCTTSSAVSAATTGGSVPGNGSAARNASAVATAAFIVRRPGTGSLPRRRAHSRRRRLAVGAVSSGVAGARRLSVSRPVRVVSTFIPRYRRRSAREA